jgi:hypothetical protein
MATVRDWADAYLAQARADLEAVRLLGGRAPSVTAMLLQMTFEKLGKAALLRSSAVSLEWAKTTHAAASRMLLVMQRQRGLFAPMGGPQVWQDVLWTVATLERAHPQLAQGAPQLEYPWETPTGAIQWPARDLAIAAALSDPRRGFGARVARFASLLAERFDQIFP